MSARGNFFIEFTIHIMNMYYLKKCTTFADKIHNITIKNHNT